MKKLLQAACILLITVGFASMAHAQLASYVDENGTVIYINGDAPQATPGKTAKPPAPAATGTQASGESAAGPAATGDAAGGTAAAASAISGAGPVSAPSKAPAAYNRAVEESAEKHHVDPALVRAVISTESSWNSAAVSPKGALGLMQLIPSTAQSLGVGNPFDPKENIDAGVRYLSMLLARYNGDVKKALAAYNAGPGAVDRFGGVPNYRETRDYVQKVTSTYSRSGSADSAHEPQAYDEPVPIYRTVDDTGRIIFVNE